MKIGEMGTGLDRLARSCWRKVRHASEGKARAHLRQMLKRAETVDRPETLGVYRCAQCGGWHTGHSAAREGGDRG
jgi:hypothetical protein